MSDDMKVSNGLGFPVEALAGVGRMPVNDETEQEAARVFFCGCDVGYAAAGDWGGDGKSGKRLAYSMIGNSEIKLTGQL